MLWMMALGAAAGEGVPFHFYMNKRVERADLKGVKIRGTSVYQAFIERLGGTPVFSGTRVPVQTLLDYLEGGDSLDDFLMDFPSVSREHVIAVLEAAKKRGQPADHLLMAGPPGLGGFSYAGKSKTRCLTYNV